MDTNIVIVLVASVIAIIAAVLITAKVTTNRLKKNAEGTIGNAEEKAREIIDEALKTAENKKRESLLEVKEESIRTKNELDKEIKERRAEAQRYERRVQQKEENIDKKADAIEKREASLASREESLNRMKEEVSRLNEQRVQELERISGLTSEQAKDYLLKIVEDEVKHESAVMIKEMESRAKEEADKKYTVTIQVNDVSSKNVLPPYNPFIFVESDKTRGREVHLVKYPPTDKANPSLLGTGKDVSRPDEGLYYVSIDLMPFALNMPISEFPIPEEGVRIDESYPKFATWVKSNGAQAKDWYKYPKK